jgi:hypothetical protein
MNNLRVGFLAAVLVLASVSGHAQDASTRASGQTPRDQAKETKDKALKGAERPPANSGAAGGFSPHYGHENEQLRRERQRRQGEPTLKSSDEDRAERKRLVDEWEKTQRLAPK